MADERLDNGEVSDGRSVEIAGGEESSKISGLNEKIDYLERENGKVLGENEGYKKQVEELNVAISELRADNEDLKVALQKSESDSKGLKEVAAHAVDLEAELSRLQDDFVTATSDLLESTTEVSDLKKELERVSKREKEIDAEFEAVENERDILSSRVVHLLALESGLREEIEGKEEEIRSLKKSIVELEGSLESSISLEKLKAELEKTVDSMKGEISTLENTLKEKEKLINGFGVKQKTLGNGDGEKKGLIENFGQKQWILVGGSTVAAVAVMGVACYLHAAARKNH